MKYPDDFIDKVITGDCIEVMKNIPDNSIDTIITDPPYGLEFMGKEWDKFKKGKNIGGGTMKNRNTPYQGNITPPAYYIWTLEQKKEYQTFTYQWAREAFRVAKPGATLLCFGGTRTWHRLACGLEDAGWIIKDTLMFLHGQGFPKSLNIGKAVDKLQGNKREIIGRYIDPDGREYKQTGNRKNFTAGNSDEVENCSDDRFIITKGDTEWEGYGSSLKPAYEPIIMAMKPNDGSYAENALKWGVAGLNIDETRIKGVDWQPEKVLKKYTGNNKGNDSVTNNFGVEEIKCTDPESVLKGRFPANLILDEISAEMLDEQSKIKGGASRFFYVAKASKKERNAGLEEMPLKIGGGMKGTEDQTLLTGSGNIRNNKMQNIHPTVKSIKLMEYLVKLTKMPNSNQIYLDPFAGSGSTLIAVINNDRHFIGIEQEPEYVKIAEKRIEYWKRKKDGNLNFEEGE